MSNVSYLGEDAPSESDVRADEEASGLSPASTTFHNGLLEDSVRLAVEMNTVSLETMRTLIDVREVDQETQIISAAAEEMASSVARIQEHSGEVRRASASAMGAMDESSKTVQAASSTMDRIVEAVQETSNRTVTLNEASQKIVAIVRTIEGIASQTNLLALNASIEAARAGKAGMGFGVVANEVKALAGETSKATEDIRTRIESLMTEMGAIASLMSESTAAVSEGQEAMQRVDAKMGEVHTEFAAVTHQVEEIALILDEQGTATSDVARGIVSVAERTKSNVARLEVSANSLEGVDTILESQLKKMESLDLPHAAVRLAKSDHAIWKKRVAETLLGHSRLRSEELADHHSCRFGKWYDGEGSRVFGHLQVFKDLEKVHRLVHQHGIAAVRHFEKAENAEAFEKLSKMEVCSTEVQQLLDLLIAQSS